MSYINNHVEGLNELEKIKNELYSPDQLFEMVENLILKRNFKLIQEIFSYLLQKLGTNRKNKVILYYYQARAFNVERKTSLALEIIDLGISNLLAFSKIDNDSKNLLHLFYIEKYHCYILEGRYEEPLNYYKSLLKHDFPGISYNIKLYLYILMATIYFEQGNYIDAIEINNEALKVAQDPKFSKYLPIILNQIGSIHLAMNKIEFSIETFKLSLNTSEEFNNHYFICKNLVDIAMSLYFQNQINNDDFFEEKYRLYYQKLHKNDIFSTIMNLVHNKDCEEAKILELLKKEHNRWFEIKYRIIIFELLIEKNIRKLQISLSIEHLNNLHEKLSLMQEIAEKNKLITIYFKTKILLAKYHLIRSDFQDSKEILLKSIANSKKYKLPKFTKLFEIEYQKAQMNSILFGNIKNVDLIDSAFSKQHINELLYYLYNFHYLLSIHD